jgi:hypothetical protein
MRFALAPLVTAAALLASCATKVGDRMPTRVTSLDPTQSLRVLEDTQLVRLCIDVKSLIGPDDRTRAACQLDTIYYARQKCADDFATCIDKAPVDDSDHFGDCNAFFRDARSCGFITVGEYSDCIVARGKQLLAIASAAPSLCTDDPTSLLTSPYLQTPPECERVKVACGPVAGEPSL